MASLSNYLQNSLINYLLRDGIWSKPSEIAVCLLTSPASPSDTGSLSGKEVINGNGYSRQVVPVSDSSWQVPTIGITSNIPTISFPTATGSWGTVVGAALVDNSTYGSGNLLLFGTLSTQKVISQNDTFKFDPNSLIWTIT